jgi:DNA-directed RNA polymerase subunit RPC12/RpoP
LRGRIQRYKCTHCGHRFQYKKRTAARNEQLWHEYVHGKQTLKELEEKHGKSVPTIRAYLDTQILKTPKDVLPQPTVIIADTTFWGRHYGVVVFRSWDLRRNLWWSEVSSEKQAHYFYGRKILEDKGWTFTAAVVDGRRGLATVFQDMPVQICHFHQIQRVTTYLTKKPQTDAARELRTLSLTLPKTDEATFTDALTLWEKRWHNFYTEKTYVTGTQHWYYTHKNVRSAYLSLKKNLPHLFTYQKHPELSIPNTTNSIDGSFASLKQKVAAHCGLRRDRRYKIISELLRGKDNSSP